MTLCRWRATVDAVAGSLAQATVGLTGTACRGAAPSCSGRVRARGEEKRAGCSLQSRSQRSSNDRRSANDYGPVPGTFHPHTIVPMLLPRSVLADLELRLGLPTPGLRVVDLEIDLDPLALVRSGASSFGFAGFFASPGGRVVGGVGAARRFSALGPDRLLAVDAPTRGLAPGVPLLVGFAFSEDGPSGPDWEGFAAASVVVPEVTVIREGGGSHLIMAIPPGSDGRSVLTLLSTLERPGPPGDAGDVEGAVAARPAPSDYVGLIDEAIGAIRAGSLSKVVLARSVLVRRSLPIDAFALVARLRDAHPSSWVFGWQEGDGVFVGASPELLVAGSGDGEIAIGLRCALLRGHSAIAYAGNGIVADSIPAAELEETRLKLRPMLDLFTLHGFFWGGVFFSSPPARAGE